jgi:hypothetical protein
MINEQLLRQGLQKLLKDTESAIRERLGDEPSLEAGLRERHSAAVRAERTEGSAKGYNAFADEAITQAAVHWLLGCVFVRFLEDNGWLDERNSKVAWIAGPGERLAIAKGRRTPFLRPDPDLTDRDYLLHVFTEVAKLPGVVGLFDQKHNPLYSLQPTAQGAAKIVEFFQKVDPDSNELIHDFTDPAHGTRFLGDLYQNLSESARKRFALCQTPGFVIDFILDRTLTPHWMLSGWRRSASSTRPVEVDTSSLPHFHDFSLHGRPRNRAPIPRRWFNVRLTPSLAWT